MYDKPCKEIFKLKRMLEKAQIPFDFIKNFGYDSDDIAKTYPELMEHYHICYPMQGDNMRISIIEGFGTHGREQDKLEILGGFTPLEKFNHGDSPIGFLTADNVFKRIKKDWEKAQIHVGERVMSLKELRDELKDTPSELDLYKHKDEEGYCTLINNKENNNDL